MLDFDRIEDLAKRGPSTETEVRRVLSRLDTSAWKEGLGLEDAAVLLNTEDKALLETIFRKAGEVKERVFGRRAVLFAPLYLSNYCVNGCLYCGFRNSGEELARKALTPEEAAREARALVAMGFKRVLLVTGEDPRYGIDYIVSCVRAVYENSGMRIVHLNAPPVDVDSLRALKKAGVGVFQVFQETYHRPTYRKMHPFGKKSDFHYRLTVMDRAVAAGFDDLGLGPLLGLYDYRFDCLATIAHSRHLFERYGAHAHTLSIPRLRPAPGSALGDMPYEVSDEDLRKVVAVFRLAVPTAGVVVSTREAPELRSELLGIGASQLSAASRTDPGGYAEEDEAGASKSQFNTNDHRGLIEVMRSIADEGYVPSLCTTCYRVGRTGPKFTGITGSGNMERLCTANAALTLKEFLLDQNGKMNGMRAPMEKALERCLDEIRDPELKKTVIEKIKELERGKRDLFF